LALTHSSRLLVTCLTTFNATVGC